MNLFISPACHPNTYQIINGDSLDFQCISNGNQKCPIVKAIFAVNKPLKLFRATVANADTGSLKSLHYYLIRIWTTCLRDKILMVKINFQTTIFQRSKNYSPARVIR